MKISIIGAGKSGFAAAKLAQREGYKIFVSDSKDPTEYPEEKEFFDKNSIEYEFGEHTDRILDCDMIVSSPGVPPTFEYFLEAEKKNIAIVSELEFAFSYMEGQKAIVAVTGTNGKTTIVNMLDHIVRESGYGSILSGNVGYPLSDFVGQEKDKVIIIEASSYQLDRINQFRPDIAVISNITPDHLSYHGSFVEYFRAKWKITANQKPLDTLILNGDDSVLAQEFREPDFNIGGELPEKETDAQKLYFSQHKKVKGAYIEDGWIWIDTQHKEIGGFMPLSQIAIPGSHNVYNTMAAILACRYLEIPDEDIRDSVASFKGVEHRLEHVATLDGADWYNDSKATNINAAWYGLSSFKRPIIWLAGGKGDNNDYFALSDLVKQNVKNVIAYGEEASEIFNAYSSSVACDKVDNLEEAVQLANSLAESDDIILLSPACKSFDQYLNFEERGKHFKSLVKDLL